MGTILISSIIGDARTDLADPSGTRFTDAVMLQYANDCSKEIVNFKPSAYSTTAARQLASGTKQTLPSGATVLLDVSRNMGLAGTTPGNVPMMGDRKTMDRAMPGWHTDTAGAEVTDWFYDREKDPLTYYVYPPQPATGMGWVEEITAKVPPEMASVGTAIPLSDAYHPHYLNYLKARALAKNAKSLKTGEAGNYYAIFLQLLGIKMQSERGAGRGNQSN